MERDQPFVYGAVGSFRFSNGLSNPQLTRGSSEQSPGACVAPGLRKGSRWELGEQPPGDGFLPSEGQLNFIIFESTLGQKI